MTLRSALASVIFSVLLPGVGGYVACLAITSDMLIASSLAVASAICFICAGLRLALDIEYVGNDEEEDQCQ